jgi:ketosteroid isomerase-like protein
MTPKEVVKKSYEAFAAGDMPTLASLCAEDTAVKMGGEMPIFGDYTGFEAWATGQLAKTQALWRNFKLEFVNMFEDEGNVFTILKMTADGLEALSCHHAVIKNEKYAEFYIFDDTQKMASAMNVV